MVIVDDAFETVFEDGHIEVEQKSQRAAVDFYRTAIALKLAEEEQVAGVVLNFSRPKEPLDVYMG